MPGQFFHILLTIIYYLNSSLSIFQAIWYYRFYMKKPLVSVIIPVYNRAHLLKEAVSSVLAQTFKGFELIIADDCSDDRPKKVLGSISGAADADIKYIRLEKHSGMPGLVRNRGVETASSPVIAFLDSDDIWLPEKLEKQYSILTGTSKETALNSAERGESTPDYPLSGGKARICHTREKWLRSGRVVSQSSQRHKREGDIFEDSLWKCIIGPSTVMMEKALFESCGGFREDLEVAEDYELWLKVTASESVAYIDEMLTVKRAGEWEQLSEKYGQIEIFRINALKNLLEKGFFSSMPDREAAAKEVFSRKCMIYAAGCRKRGRDEEASAYQNLSIGLYS